MIPRFLPRPQWEEKLKNLGAGPLAGKTKLNTAEWWHAPGGIPFTVPIEPDGSCDFWAFQRVCQRLGDKTFPPFED